MAKPNTQKLKKMSRIEIIEAPLPVHGVIQGRSGAVLFPGLLSQAQGSSLCDELWVELCDLRLGVAATGMLFTTNTTHQLLGHYGKKKKVNLTSFKALYKVKTPQRIGSSAWQTTQPLTPSSSQEPISTTFSYKLLMPWSKWLLPFITSHSQLALLGIGLFTLGETLFSHPSDGLKLFSPFVVKCFGLLFGGLKIDSYVLKLIP